MSTENDRYVECEICGEKFWGENDIAAYTTTTWRLDRHGDEEGVEHCRECPLETEVTEKVL